MVLSRPSALKTAIRTNLLRPTLRSAGPRQLQRVARRTYADGGHHAPAKSNDLTWGLVATAVTAPATWYLLQPGADAHHGDDHGHDKEEHEEEHADDAETSGEGGDEEQKSDEGAQQGEEKQQDESKEAESEDKGDAGSNEGAGEDGDAPKDETRVLEGESKDLPEGVRFKGKTNQGDEDNEMTATRKSIPDAKGGTKKRLDSDYAVRQGLSKEESDESGSENESPAARIPPRNQNEMAGKQRGLSNTETKHSTDISNSPEKSKKGEGTPETAKTIGTVKVDRPQVSLAVKKIEYATFY
ncbi:MAG: hypothetical protein M1821_000148 [Bathelium mastoideum]|nr:MAG: hypothetical protein M1821_000148 [Bathelium mastoideum]KAI9687820.1 MAG: hypothetical protein M1822_001900 [Bathelium mastoideum]